MMQERCNRTGKGSWKVKCKKGLEIYGDLYILPCGVRFMPCIIHITTVHRTFDVRIFHKEAKTLAQAGYEVTLIAQHDMNDMVDGIKILALPKIEKRAHRILVLTWKALWIALRQKGDIYHLHDPELLPMGVLLKLIKGKRLIYDAHEDYSKQMLSKLYLPRGIRKEIAFLVSIIEYFCSKVFDAIITATDDILKKFVYHERAVSVKNFPIVSHFSIQAKNMEREKEVFRLIYIGGLAEIRGITEIVRALELINSNAQLKLTLCGPFYPAHYELKVRSLEGFKKVEYLGWVDPRDIPNLLKMHDVGIVCLHPLIRHITSLPLKLFEYMAAGLAVVASNFPLWKEIVEGNACGICVDPLNVKEIARTIIHLMDQPRLRKEMGENGRRMVLEKYNWEKEGAKLLDLYAQLSIR